MLTTRFRQVSASGYRSSNRSTPDTISLNASLWTLMPAPATLHTNPDIISAGTVGRATGTSSSGRLFYNFFNRSVMVKGQINYISTDGLTRRAVSTYNFTVSPRG